MGFDFKVLRNNMEKFGTYLPNATVNLFDSLELMKEVKKSKRNTVC